MRKRQLKTERLTLRPWRESDARVLFDLAKDPRIGPVTGWRPHIDVSYSRDIIKEILMSEDTFAVTKKREADTPIGSISLFKTHATGFEDELEIGYWLGYDYWGNGFIPEAVNALLNYAFCGKKAKRVWCAHFEGNFNSQRVIEKCGFSYKLSCESYLPQLDERRNTLYYSITSEEFLCRSI